MAAPEGLLALENASNPAIDDYFKHVVNGGLGRYRAIEQYGAKTGQTLFMHVLDGVTVLETLRGCLELTDLEARLLFAAYSVHDINKVPARDGERCSYNDLATPDRLAEELEALGVDGLLAEWREYLNDITYLARAHQGHLAVVADGLNRRRAVQYRLSLERLEQLGFLMKAADGLDLSDELGESRKKTQFLAWVNAASPGRSWALTWHRLAENRGILTNVMHNALVELLGERFGAVPLLYYADGVTYLVPAEQSLTWSEAEWGVAARAVGQALARLQREELASFVSATKDGIKVAQSAFDSGADLDTLIDLIASRVEAKSYTADKQDDYERNVREKDLRAGQAKVRPEGQALLAELLAETGELLSRDQSALQAGELALAYKLLLSAYASSREVKRDPWPRVYELFGLPVGVRAVADLVNATRRGRFLARWLDLSLAHYEERLRADAPSQVNMPADQAGLGDLEAYLRAYLDLPFETQRARRLSQALVTYSQGHHQQCCHCGSLGSASEWMSANVPASLGVQSFSNRLPGGVNRDPKRNVCRLCGLQYTLEKLAWVNHRDKQGKEQRTFYLHLFPRTFFTAPFLVAWRQAATRLLREEHTAFLVNTGAYFREWQADGPERVPIYKTRVNGVAVPRLAETMSNTPVLPVHAPGANYREQFLLAMETAVVLQRFFGCRVLLSRLPVPPLTPSGETVLFLEGIPAALGWLLPTDAFDGAAMVTLLRRLQALHRARAALSTGPNDPPIVLDLVSAATDDPLGVYFVAERLIERRQQRLGGTAGQWTGIRLAQEIGPLLDELAGGRR